MWVVLVGSANRRKYTTAYRLAQNIQDKFGIKLDILSGGSTCALPLIEKTNCHKVLINLE